MSRHYPVTLHGLALLALTLLSLACATAQTGTISYNIPLFREEQALTDPINHRAFWFQMRPGVRLTQSPVLHLRYAYSQTILEHEGTISVLANGIPVASRVLYGSAGVLNEWNVTIPSGLLRPGYNEIRIVTRQRSIEGLCRDIDNDANWVRLEKTTTLAVTRYALASFPLYCYPFPCLDYLATGTTNANAVWVLPPNPTPREVQVMLATASNWGLREPLAKLSPFVTTHIPASGNAVIFGRYNRWPALFTEEMPAGATKPNAGWLALNGGDGNVHMIIAGQDDEGVEKASRLASDPEAVEQLDLQELTVPGDRMIPFEVQPAHKANYFTFASLGAPKISLNGAFHQKTTVTLTRPVREMIGRESYLKVYFRHSATLNVRRSMLTVTVNGQKVGSVALSKDNIQGGTLTMPLPVQELDADQWNIGLLAYHDLGTIDCSKRYDEVAWTVIEGKSHIVLMPGRVPGYASLANFPYAMKNTGEPAKPITMWLPGKPSDAMLSAAAAIAARAGQANLVPLRWRVVMGETLPANARGGVVIMLGTPQESRRFNVVNSKLPIQPTPQGYKVRGKLRVVPESWKEPAILEAVNDRGSHGVLYAVIGANDGAFRRLARSLPEPETLRKLGAQIAVFTREGHMFAFTTIDTEKRRIMLEKEQNRYTVPMKVAVGIFILVALMLFGRLLWMLRRRPRPVPLEPPSTTPSGI
jgi:hypothetical protein